MLLRSSILVIVLILIWIHISNIGFLSSIGGKDSQKDEIHMGSTLSPINDNFDPVVGSKSCFQWQFCFRILNLVVKCLCLRRYFVTIQSRNSGVIFLQQVQTLPNVSFLDSFRQGLRGDYWVLYNYIKAEKQFQVFSPRSHTLVIKLSVQWVYYLHNTWRLWVLR